MVLDVLDNCHIIPVTIIRDQRGTNVGPTWTKVGLTWDRDDVTGDRLILSRGRAE